jgi:3-hydroxyacyl-CoA dehydrogenase/3a,7a,12a-trihydroxy-5b-cholest-24-enoyl-CoA hydratase/multifunctional beta-oxidation protein/peroxisomal enoyl-CoA hydratase 2
MGVVIPNADFLSPLIESPHVPPFNPFGILHAEQKLTMIQPKLQVGTKYGHYLKLVDCTDKGKNAFVQYKVDTYSIAKDGKRELAFSNENTLFIKGLGGFKFPGKGLIKPMLEVPQRDPDFKFEACTFPSQALLYRLSGDANPLHIDPGVAAGQNFERPILHGLATKGVVARALVQNLLKNDPTRLKTIRTRFIGHVYPGEILEVAVWKLDESTFVFEARVPSRKSKTVLGHIETRPAASL